MEATLGREEDFSRDKLLTFLVLCITILSSSIGKNGVFE